MKQNLFLLIPIFSNHNGWSEDCGSPISCPDNAYPFRYCDEDGFIATFSAKYQTVFYDYGSQWTPSKMNADILPLCLYFDLSGPESILMKICGNGECKTPEYVYYKSDVENDIDEAMYNKITGKELSNDDKCMFAKLYCPDITPVIEIPENSKNQIKDNYPNPFEEKTNICFYVDSELEAKVVINIYDSYGNLIRNLIDQNFGKGPQAVVFDAHCLQSGVYFYKIIIDNEISYGKMQIFK